MAAYCFPSLLNRFQPSLHCPAGKWVWVVLLLLADLILNPPINRWLILERAQAPFCFVLFFGGCVGGWGCLKYGSSWLEKGLLQFTNYFQLFVENLMVSFLTGGLWCRHRYRPSPRQCKNIYQTYLFQQLTWDKFVFCTLETGRIDIVT